MGKKKAAENSTTPNEEKEGHNLLGKPKFKKLENGRLRCVQTGHELPAHSTESYAQTKHCRLGLIDSALAKNKLPLNMFEQDPSCRMKLICKLTGDIINKTEEHIWKHINGKRFLNMLEKKEAEKEEPEIEIVKEDEIEIVTEQDEENAKKDKERKKKKKKKEKLKAEKKLKKEKKIVEEAENGEDNIVIVKKSEENSGDLENEEDFWMPPEGERWDHDDGGDRWASDTDSGSEDGDVVEEDVAVEESEHDEAHKLSKQTKRMSLEIGPSSFASKKKKRKISAVENV